MKIIKKYVFRFFNFFKRKYQNIYTDNELVEWLKSIIKYDNDKFIKINDVKEIYDCNITEFTFLGYHVDLT